MTDFEKRYRVDPTEWLKRLVLSLCALVLAMLAVGMLGALSLYLNKSHPFPQTYSLSVAFPDAQGVEAGGQVKMSGVVIGTVERVTLQNQQAVVSMHIQDSTKIARGSRFVAVPFLLSVPASIAVLPPAGSNAGVPPVDTAESIAPDEANLVGEAAPGVSDMLLKAKPLLEDFTRISRQTSTLLEETTRMLKGVNTVVGDPRTQRELRETSASLHQAASGGARLMPELSLTLRQTRERSQALLSNLTDASAELRTLSRESRPQITSILGNVRQTTASASRLVEHGDMVLQHGDAVVQQGHDLLQRGDDLLKNEKVGAKLSETLDTISQTATNLKALSEKMNTIASSTQNLVGDPQMTSDLRQTLHNVQALSEKMNGFAASAQPLLDDPATAADLKDTLHNLKDVSAAANVLLNQLTKAAGKSKK